MNTSWTIFHCPHPLLLLALTLGMNLHAEKSTPSLLWFLTHTGYYVLYSTATSCLFGVLQMKRRMIYCSNVQCQSHTWRFGRQWRWGEFGCVCGRYLRPTSSEKASYQATLKRLHKGRFSRSRVSKQLQFDPGLRVLSVSQLLDKKHPVRILKFNIKKKSECVARSSFQQTQNVGFK